MSDQPAETTVHVHTEQRRRYWKHETADGALALMETVESQRVTQLRRPDEPATEIERAPVVESTPPEGYVEVTAEDYRQAQNEIKARHAVATQEAAQQAADHHAAVTAARESAAGKLRELGLDDAEIAALTGR